MINGYITGEQTQGTVVSKLTPRGLFWLKIVRRESEGTLLVISQSIRCDIAQGSGRMSCVVYRADIEHDLIKPVTKVIVGQLCCACFSEDKQWHRAQVVDIVSPTRVSSTSIIPVPEIMLGHQTTSNHFLNFQPVFDNCLSTFEQDI